MQLTNVSVVKVYYINIAEVRLGIATSPVVLRSKEIMQNIAPQRES